ncbi:CotH kinase family protein [Ascidiimonas sp. W6]|uniref:CotH kinase family protein n=1 Tax=Ascidiimonas meishanensis TaxID=3128903 RepID=UPI0030EEB2DF
MRSFSNLCLLSLLMFVIFSCSKETTITDPPEEEILPENRLPRVSINTNGGVIVDEPKINAQMTITVNDEIDYEGAIGIEIRGATSQFYPKKQFGLETRDAANEDIDVSLLGFPEEEDWILHAPYSDKSLIRNVLIYDLSRAIGRYTSRTKFVDVYINESYNGVYVLMEKLKRDNNRIDINKLKEDENSGEDLTGGYILKLDKADGSAPFSYTPANSFISNYEPLNANSGQQIRFSYDTPDEEDITTEQRVYISNYMSSFENALSSSDFKDPDTGYAAYIDTQSFIDFFLLNELSNNVDGYRLSTWLVKDKNEKLKMGPIWDFNIAFGNANYCGGGLTNVWTYKFNERCPNDFWLLPFWWDRLLQDPAFVTQLKARWADLRGGEFSEAAILQRIDTYVETLTLSGGIKENFKKWVVLGTYIIPNNFVGNTYEEEEEYLKNWIKDRLSWLDTEIAGL